MSKTRLCLPSKAPCFSLSLPLMDDSGNGVEDDEASPPELNEAPGRCAATRSFISLMMSCAGVRDSVAVPNWNWADSPKTNDGRAAGSARREGDALGGRGEGKPPWGSQLARGKGDLAGEDETIRIPSSFSPTASASGGWEKVPGSVESDWTVDCELSVVLEWIVLDRNANPSRLLSEPLFDLSVPSGPVPDFSSASLFGFD